MLNWLRNITAGVVWILLVCNPAVLLAARDLPMPGSTPVLKVSGAIGCLNLADAAVFDIEMLRRLPQTQIKTSTIWTDRAHEFTGVALKDFVLAIRANGSVLRARALNDYKVDIPLSDAVAGGAIIAYLMDGEPMSVRNKGPLWIVYPYDDNPRYQNEITYSRSIWQLDTIVVAD